MKSDTLSATQDSQKPLYNYQTSSIEHPELYGTFDLKPPHYLREAVDNKPIYEAYYPAKPQILANPNRSSIYDILKEHGYQMTDFGLSLLAEETHGMFHPHRLFINPTGFVDYVDEEEGIALSVMTQAITMIRVLCINDEEELTSDPDNRRALEQLQEQAFPAFRQMLGSINRQRGTSHEMTENYLRRLFMMVPTNRQLMLYGIHETYGTFEKTDLSPDFQTSLLIRIYMDTEYGFVTSDGYHIFREWFDTLHPRFKEQHPVHEALIEENSPGYVPGEPLTVYRGECSRSTPLEQEPLSWTTDPKVAERFARRFLTDDDSSGNQTGKGWIHTGVIEPSDFEAIYFYTNQRNEHEVVVPIDVVKNITSTPVYS